MKKLFLALVLIVAAGCTSSTVTSPSRSSSSAVNPDQTVERIEVFNTYSPAER